MSLFGETAPDLKTESKVKGIRQAMLDCCAGLGESEDIARVWGRVLYAPDIQALWYLRSDVMTLLASRVGESVAREHVQAITEMFKGLLPSAQKSRPTRLSK